MAHIWHLLNREAIYIKANRIDKSRSPSSHLYGPHAQLINVWIIDGRRLPSPDRRRPNMRGRRTRPVELNTVAQPAESKLHSINNEASLSWEQAQIRSRLESSTQEERNIMMNKAPPSLLVLCLTILAAVLIIVLAMHVEPAQAGKYKVLYYRCSA